MKTIAAGWVLLGLAGFAPMSRADDALAACNAPDATTVLDAAPSDATARAVWLDARRLRWGGSPVAGRFRLYRSHRGVPTVDADGRVRDADAAFDLTPDPTALPAAWSEAFRWVGEGPVLALSPRDAVRWRNGLRSASLLVREDTHGRVLAATHTQDAALLDAVFAAAAERWSYEPSVQADATTFALWAPTARAVQVCVYPDAQAAATRVAALRVDPRSGRWSARLRGDWRGRYYRYLVDVFVPGTGWVRNRVSDPYAVSLSANGARAWLGDLDDPALKPAGWPLPSPFAGRPAVDQVIYELHIRDFSVSDSTVPAAHRGRYLAFADADSAGMRHLRALAEAGMTHVHLLPVFDFATVPEIGCESPDIDARGDDPRAQAMLAGIKARDCFNWGYDPLHFGAPEGSYASAPDDGATRIREFRAMVLGLNRAGLAVGMDVVYNHMSASGQHDHALLDRIVPGYYHRRDGEGRVTTSTCCANTATEHRMMAKLMIDTAVRWVRHYGIDAFRFDLMGHQPRSAMLALQSAVNAAAGHPVPLIGEGWNFGEVADGARFVQAAQGRLDGSGIATFSDRARDAVRGGGPADQGDALLTRKGFVTGLADAARSGDAVAVAELRQAADGVRVGLAGSLRDYTLQDATGRTVVLSDLRYGNQPAGYVSAPDEVVNYVENHDNQTFFDIAAWKLPRNTTRDDRARAQLLAGAITLFSQGIAYVHAGFDVLRSKSMDRNSFESGDAFNRLDWQYRDNGFGKGLPPASDNAASWPGLRDILTDPRIAPEPAQIAWMRDAFRDLLRLRASSTLFRLPTAAAIRQRLHFANVGPAQEPTVLAAWIDGDGLPGANARTLAYFVNVDRVAHTIAIPELADMAFRLHPVQASADAADPRPAREARFDPEGGHFIVPALSAVVFVRD